MEERICEMDEFLIWSKRTREWQMVRTKVMTLMRWYAQDEVNQEDSEHNEIDGMKKGADSTGKLMHIYESIRWFVMRKIKMVELRYGDGRWGASST